MTKEEKLLSERKVLIAYMKAKIQSEDWHAVADAANDLREIDRELEVRKSICEKDMVDVV